MTKINGRQFLDVIEVSEHDERVNTRLVRSAINRWLVSRGLTQAESYLGIRGAAARSRERAARKNKR